MKYYKIILAGKGAELYPFELNTEQYEKLREGGVEQDELEYDQICEILGVDSYFDSPNETIMGPFPQTFILRVEDEEGKVVYETVLSNDQNSLSIDLSNFAPSAYYLNVIIDNIVTYKETLVVRK